jgi:hypothetical protein
MGQNQHGTAAPAPCVDDAAVVVAVAPHATLEAGLAETDVASFAVSEFVANIDPADEKLARLGRFLANKAISLTMLKLACRDYESAVAAIPPTFESDKRERLRLGALLAHAVERERDSAFPIVCTCACACACACACVCACGPFQGSSALSTATRQTASNRCTCVCVRAAGLMAGACTAVALASAEAAVCSLCGSVTQWQVWRALESARCEARLARIVFMAEGRPLAEKRRRACCKRARAVPDSPNDLDDLVFLAALLRPHHLTCKYQFNQLVLQRVHAVVRGEDRDRVGAALFNEARDYFRARATTFDHVGHSAFCVVKLAARCRLETIDDLRSKWQVWAANKWVGPHDERRCAPRALGTVQPAALPQGWPPALPSALPQGWPPALPQALPQGWPSALPQGWPPALPQGVVDGLCAAVERGVRPDEAVRQVARDDPRGLVLELYHFAREFAVAYWSRQLTTTTTVTASADSATT